MSEEAWVCEGGGVGAGHGSLRAFWGCRVWGNGEYILIGIKIYLNDI